MPHRSPQTFLRELDKKLWTAADKLPAGTEILNERGHLARSYKITSTGKLIDDALEAVEKENPKLKNVPLASLYVRRTLKSRTAARQPNHSQTKRRRTKPRKISDGRRPTLQLQIDPANLAGLIDLIATILFQHADLHAKDILGHVCDSSRATKSSHRGGSRVSRVQPMRTLPPMAVI